MVVLWRRSEWWFNAVSATEAIFTARTCYCFKQSNVMGGGGDKHQNTRSINHTKTVKHSNKVCTAQLLSKTLKSLPA